MSLSGVALKIDFAWGDSLLMTYIAEDEVYLNYDYNQYSYPCPCLNDDHDMTS